jgi:hypothetical protein
MNKGTRGFATRREFYVFVGFIILERTWGEWILFVATCIGTTFVQAGIAAAGGEKDTRHRSLLRKTARGRIPFARL